MLKQVQSIQQIDVLKHGTWLMSKTLLKRVLLQGHPKLSAFFENVQWEPWALNVVFFLFCIFFFLSNIMTISESKIVTCLPEIILQPSRYHSMICYFCLRKNILLAQGLFQIGLWGVNNLKGNGESTSSSHFSQCLTFSWAYKVPFW